MNDPLKDLETRCREALESAVSLSKEIAEIEAHSGAVLLQVRALDAEAEKLESDGYEAEAKSKREEAENIRLDGTRWPDGWKVIEYRVRVHQKEVDNKLQEYELTPPANIAELEKKDAALRLLKALQQCFWNFSSRVSLAQNVDLNVLPWVGKASGKKRVPSPLELLAMYEKDPKGEFSPQRLGDNYRPDLKNKESRRAWANKEIAKGKKARGKS